jgi:glycosyltransferase involved in cell wall biosynthesis
VARIAGAIDRSSFAIVATMISILIPASNHAKYLPDALASVLQQDIADIEIMVCDDASTDDTPAIVQSIVERNPGVRYFRNETSLGTVRNINQGIERARGRFIAILSAEDALVPGGLQALESVLDAHPECGYAYGRYTVVDAGGRPVAFQQAGWLSNAYFGTRDELPDLLRFDLYVNIGGATLFRKEVFDGGRFFDVSLPVLGTAPEFKASDLALVLELAQREIKSAFVNREVAFYRAHADRIAASQTYLNSGVAFREFSVLLQRFFTERSVARLLPYLNDILAFYLGKLDALKIARTPESSRQCEVCEAQAAEVLESIKQVIAAYGQQKAANALAGEHPSSALPTGTADSRTRGDAWKAQAREAISANRGARESIAALGSEPNVDEADWETNLLLGILYGQLNDVETATRCLEISLAGNDRNADTVFFLGHFRALPFSQSNKRKYWAIRRDHAREALRLIEGTSHATSWPQLKPCLEMYATAAGAVGPTEEAEYAYRWLIRIDPEEAGHYAKLSQLRADDNLEEAVELLSKAQSINSAATPGREAEFSRAVLRNNSRRSPRARAKYPTTSEMSGDLRAAIQSTLIRDLPRQDFIRKDTKFFTIGSCFAAEIANRLLERGYVADFFQLSEHINSTFANRSMMDWALGQCNGQPRERLDELFLPRGVTPANLKARLAEAEVLIYTLGVAPAFFDRQSKAFAMPTDSSLGSRAFAELFDFRTTTVQENFDNLEYITTQIRALNPNVRFVITVSPVPLHATFEFKSAIQADCVSKSILRVVAHEFVTQYPDVVYWPSFEVVRWLGGHVGPFYGLDDGAAWHVGTDVVKTITDLFIDHFSAA